MQLSPGQSGWGILVLARLLSFEVKLENRSVDWSYSNQGLTGYKAVKSTCPPAASAFGSSDWCVFSPKSLILLGCTRNRARESIRRDYTGFHHDLVQRIEQQQRRKGELSPRECRGFHCLVAEYRVTTKKRRAEEKRIRQFSFPWSREQSSNIKGEEGRKVSQRSVIDAAAMRGHGGRSIVMGACRSLFSSASSATVVQKRLQNRWMSNLPENTVYGGPISQTAVKRVTLRHLLKKYASGQPITMVTAYDYPSAVHVDLAGIDVALVGDSVAMVVHGHDTTLPINLDDMLLHCRAVARGAQRPFLVGDLPFGSYEQSSQQAVNSATRILKEGGMDAVKMEGGIGSRVAAAKAIAEAGIAVMGHVGLTPQAISILGGFRPQGRSSGGAVQVLEHALALQDAGCFAVILECVPSPVAAALTATLEIPTIGIGAGPHCSGQVLVYHDILGMMQHPHYLKVTPKFCKLYAKVGEIVQEALSEYNQEVSTGVFPSPVHTPYRLEKNQLEPFIKELHHRGFHDAADAAHGAAKNDAEADHLKAKTA